MERRLKLVREKGGCNWSERKEVEIGQRERRLEWVSGKYSIHIYKKVI